jgi:hypothetical protein
MPYIKSDDGRRKTLQHGDTALTAGELNYQIFYYIKHQESKGLKSERVYFVLKAFVNQFLGEKPNYQRYNDMVGCLVLCAKEIHRRLKIDLYEVLLKQIIDSYDEEIAIYEDKKCLENGDVE